MLCERCSVVVGAEAQIMCEQGSVVVGAEGADGEQRLC